jgi:hypothetical protein
MAEWIDPGWSEAVTGGGKQVPKVSSTHPGTLDLIRDGDKVLPPETA